MTPPPRDWKRPGWTRRRWPHDGDETDICDRARFDAGRRVRYLFVTERAAPGRRTLAVIADVDVSARLRSFVIDARRAAPKSVVTADWKRLWQVQPEANSGSVEHVVWQAIHALQKMLNAERRETPRLLRTLQKISEDGAAKTAADLTLMTMSSDGCGMPLERGHPDLEAVVLKHPMTINDDARNAAGNRLAKAGLDPNTFKPEGD